jgi:cytochrome c
MEGSMISKNRCWSGIIYKGLLVLVLGLAAACSKEEQAAENNTTIKDVVIKQPGDETRTFSVNSITRGALVFQERCAECHGPQAQGHPGWTPTQGKNTKGKQIVVAPPLDGTGVAHKRKKAQLVKVITRGIKRDNVPVMPEWKGRLSDQDIEDVITWFQALWPPKVYEAWSRVNQGTISSKTGS